MAAATGGARALFTTRRGGVSTGPFASLNLGRLTADDGANVDENRRRVAAATGHPRERFLYGKQVHGATVRRATEPPGPGRPPAEEDGQATALEGHPALVFVADCTPVAAHRRRRRGRHPRRLARDRGRDRGRGHRGAARGRRHRRDHGADRARRPGLLLRGRRRGPRGLRGLRRPPRRAQPRPAEGAARPARHRAGARRGRSARCAPTSSSRIAATAASRAARRGSYGAADRRARRGPRPGEPRAHPRGAAGDRADPRRREVRRPRGPGHARRSGHRARGGEPRAGPRGQGGGPPGVPLALHRPAPEPQGQGDPAARRADPLGRVGLCARTSSAGTGRPTLASSSRSTSPERTTRRGSRPPISATSSPAARSP